MDISNGFLINFGTLVQTGTFALAFKALYALCDGTYRTPNGTSGTHFQFISGAVTTTGYKHSFDSGQGGWYIGIGR